MKEFFLTRVSFGIGLLLAIWLFVIGGIQLLGLQDAFVLSGDPIEAETGCAYIAPVNRHPVGWPVTAYVSDDESAPYASRLILLRDGKSIGWSHAAHDDIRNKGGGGYSHWGNNLYFSLPDCSDPRTQEAQYTVSIPVSVSPWAKFSWLIAAVALGLLVHRGVARKPALREKIHRRIETTLDLMLSPLSLLQRPFRSALSLSTIFIVSSLYLVWTWYSGKSVSLAIAGAYQVSDSMAYWTCANALLDFGNFGNTASFTSEWCQRRAIYPSLLSGITWAAQKNIYVTLLLQAWIVSLAVFLIIRRSSLYLGLIGMLIGTALLLKYAAADVFTLTMTENAGLIFGCVGLSMLLKAAESKSLTWLVAGVAMLSVALNARAGAFFVLPFIVLWSALAAHSFNKKVSLWLGLTALAAFTGFLLQALLVYVVGGSANSSHGNFSYVLYGLSVGGMGWQQVMIDHPGILNQSDAALSKSIYALAWANINHKPELFLQGLIKNIILFLMNGSYGYEKLGALAGFIKTLWWLGWVPLLMNIKRHAYSLVVFLSLGVVLSAPFLSGDAGSRVFAASIAVDVFQIGLGARWVVERLKCMFQKDCFGSLPPLEYSSTAANHSRGRAEIGLSFVVALLIAIPHVVSGKPVLPNIQSSAACKPNEHQVITFLGARSSMVLSLVEDKQPNIFYGDVQKDRFSKGLPFSSWYRDQAMMFSGQMLLAAYQLDRSDPSAPGPYLATSDVNLSNEYYGKLVLLCISKSNEQTIFDTPYRRINSITALD